jgi:hypothetical protein
MELTLLDRVLSRSHSKQHLPENRRKNIQIKSGTQNMEKVSVIGHFVHNNYRVNVNMAEEANAT